MQRMTSERLKESGNSEQQAGMCRIDQGRHGADLSEQWQLHASGTTTWSSSSSEAMFTRGELAVADLSLNSAASDPADVVAGRS